MTNRPALAWHCTVMDRFLAIEESCELRPATAQIEKGERPALWLTLSDTWEETANKACITLSGALRSLSREETHARGGGLVRIGVDAARLPFNWRYFVARSGISKKHARELERSARRVGSDVGLWRVSFEPIARADWRAVERWNGSAWEPLEGAAVAA